MVIEMASVRQKKYLATEVPEAVILLIRRKCDPLGMSNSEYLRMLVYLDLRADGFLDPRAHPEVFQGSAAAKPSPPSQQ